MSILAEGVTARSKSDRSPVTGADLAADEVLVDGLRARFPGDGLLTEESGWASVGRSDRRRTWVVDPIDGTRALLDGSRGWAVHVGLAVEGRAVLGVVHEPARDVTRWAVSGGGAWQTCCGSAPTRIGPLADSEAAPRGWRVVTSHHFGPTRSAFLAGLGALDAGRMHSVGVKVGALLSGEADLYVGRFPVKYWDSCAPFAVLREAGGAVLSLEGRDLSTDFDFRRARPAHHGGFVATLRVPAALARARVRDVLTCRRDLEKDSPA